MILFNLNMVNHFKCDASWLSLNSSVDAVSLRNDFYSMVFSWFCKVRSNLAQLGL